MLFKTKTKIKKNPQLASVNAKSCRTFKLEDLKVDTHYNRKNPIPRQLSIKQKLRTCKQWICILTERNHTI